MTKHILEKFQDRWRLVLVSTESMDSDEVEGGLFDVCLFLLETN